MQRRQIVTCAGLALCPALGGCLDSAVPENGDGGIEDGEGNTGESEDDEPADERNEGDDRAACSFAVEVFEDPPDDAQIVAEDDERLEGVRTIERILEAAADSHADRNTVTRRSGTYEQFTVAPESNDEFEETEVALEQLPRYDDPEYPPGAYVTDGEIVVAIAGQCPT